MKIYWILFSILTIIYLLTYSTANVNCVTNAMHDDLLYFNLATNLSEFNWLGDYNRLTLAKMPGYAFFLSFCMITGIPYLILIGLAQIIAVTFFLRNSMWLFHQTKLLSFMLGTLLLFNPIFASVLRIYRLQLTTICFIIFLGVIISLFDPNTIKKRGYVKIIDGLTTAIALGLLFFSREENLFYYSIFILAILFFLLVHRNIKYIRRNIFLPITGIVGIIIFFITISFMNFQKYGRFIVCERTSAPYTKVIKEFNSVADDHLDPRYPLVSSSREKINSINKEVPEFRNIGEILIKGSPGWSIHSKYFDKEDLSFKEGDINDLPTGHFEWYWIDCAKGAGYYEDAVTLSEHYSVLAKKIHLALEDGRLKKREVLFSIGPYFVSKSDIKTIFRIIPVNYSNLLLKPKQFISKYRDLLSLQSFKDDTDDLSYWKETLKVNVIEYGDIKSLEKTKSSIHNKIWNFLVKVFAYIAIPLVHIATPLAFITFSYVLIRKKKNIAVLLLIISSSYIMHFLMLSTLDVVTGYKASEIMYFLPSYTSLLISAFISINILLTTKMGKLKV